jgi:hypothetical protein
VLAFGVVALVGVSLVGDDGLDEPDERVRNLVVELADDVDDALEGTHGPVLVRSEMQLEALFAVGDIGVEAMALAVERAGYDVRVPPSLAPKVGDHRTRDDAVAEVVMVTDEEVARAAGADVVGTVQPLNEEEAAELDRLRIELGQRGLADATVEEIPPGDNLLKRDVGRLRQLEAYQPMTVIVRPIGG